MSFPSFRPGRPLLGALLAALLCFGGPARSQTPAAKPPVDNSALDAQLFYQLLIGEIELRGGDAGTAYQVVLDAARRTRDEQLFRRATDVALQARAGDQALAAVMAWRTAIPTSAEAHRYLIQLLVALNRAGESVEPLRSLIQLTAAADRPGADPVDARLLRPRHRQGAIGRHRRARIAGLDGRTGHAHGRTRGPGPRLAGRARQRQGPRPAAARPRRRPDERIGPALLARRSACPTSPEAEAIVTAHLKAKPDSHAVRLSYVRVLTSLAALRRRHRAAGKRHAHRARHWRRPG